MVREETPSDLDEGVRMALASLMDVQSPNGRRPTSLGMPPCLAPSAACQLPRSSRQVLGTR